MVKFIGITGFEDSGKTDIVERLVKELKKRGFRVGTLKHVPQEDFTIDQEGTDTWRHAEAGAEEVHLLSPDEKVTIEKSEFSLGNVLRKIEDLDYAIVEGFRDSEIIPKIAVADTEREAERLDDVFTIAFIKNGAGEKSVFGFEDTDTILELVKDSAMRPVGDLDCGQCGFDTCGEFVQAVANGDTPQDGCIALDGKVTLKVDGKKVPLKPFVEDLIDSTISGLVSSLKEGEGDRIELELKEDGR